MTWLRRLATLLRADAHGALDALQDRQLLLRQHLREAEQALATKQARRDALDAEARDLERTADRISPRLLTLDRDVTLALERGREDLARFAVQKLLPLRRQVDGIEARQRDLGQEQAELAEILEDQGTQLDALRVRVRAALEEAHDTAGDFADGPGWVRDEDVELELLRRRAAAPAPSVDGAAP